MLSQSERSLLSLSPRHKVVPVIKSRQLLISTLDSAHPYVGTILLRNCNLFEFTGLLDRAHDRGILLLDISPALAVPHIKPQLMSSLPATIHSLWSDQYTRADRGCAAGWSVTGSGQPR